jgi:hypothetical protein
LLGNFLHTCYFSLDKCNYKCQYTSTRIHWPGHILPLPEIIIWHSCVELCSGVRPNDVLRPCYISHIPIWGHCLFRNT